MLSVADLVVRYGQITALDRVSILVREGEAVGVVGPNGAGKSSLLAAITGIVKAADGRVTFLDQPILGEVPEELVRRGISLVPEGRRIFGPLSVAENLQLGATTSRKGGRKAPTVDEMLDRFPALRALYKRQAGSLSGGEQQMLAIARALMSGPRLLLLDEPSLGLAPLVVDTVFELLEDLRKEGTTILLVEQNALRTVEFCDRTYVLRTGDVVMTGTREELLAQEDFSATFLGM
ncbi:MAG: ABC transporter ATP-binding protein [Thermoleophilia bacterium]